jgi:hypothetical protein
VRPNVRQQNVCCYLEHRPYRCCLNHAIKIDGLLASQAGKLGAVAVGRWISLRGSRFPMSLCANGGQGADFGLANTWPERRKSRFTVHNRLPWRCRKRGADPFIRTRNTSSHIGLLDGVAFALAVGRAGVIVSAYLGAGLLSLHIQLLPALVSTMLIVFITIHLVQNHIVNHVPTISPPDLPTVHQS